MMVLRSFPQQSGRFLAGPWGFCTSMALVVTIYLHWVLRGAEGQMMDALFVIHVLIAWVAVWSSLLARLVMLKRREAATERSEQEVSDGIA